MWLRKLWVLWWKSIFGFESSYVLKIKIVSPCWFMEVLVNTMDLRILTCGGLIFNIRLKDNEIYLWLDVYLHFRTFGKVQISWFYGGQVIKSILECWIWIFELKGNFQTVHKKQCGIVTCVPWLVVQTHVCVFLWNSSIFVMGLVWD